MRRLFGRKAAIDASGQLKSPTPGPTLYDKVMLLAFCVLWLVPILLVGGFKVNTSKYLGSYLGNLHRVACLFTRSVKYWRTYHVEVQTTDQPNWQELPETGYFDMHVFGYRSRLHRILGQSYKRYGGDKRINELAEFIRHRYDELNDSQSRITAIRFVRCVYGIQQLSKEKGSFKKPLVNDVPDSYKRYFGERRFDET